MINIRSSCAIAIAAVSLAACNPSPEASTQAGAEAGRAAAPASGSGQNVGNTVIWANPLVSCEKNQVVHVFWSNEALVGGAARIELGDGPNPAVFARIGKAGSKETGPWAGPGTTFVLRGATDGAERSRLVLPAPAGCN